MNANVKRHMKAWCAMKNEDVSERTEQLYVSFLRSQGITVPATVADAAGGINYPQRPRIYSSNRSRRGLIAHIETDASGLVTKIDDAFTEMCGYRFPELRGRKPGHLLQGPNTQQLVVARFREAIQAGRRFVGTLTNYHKNGSTYDVEIKMRPIYRKKNLIGFTAEERKLS